MNIYIFGDVFLRSYYSIYDFEEQKVGLALHKYSIASIEEDSRTWLIVIIVVSAALIVLGILAFIHLQKKRKQEEETRQRQEDDNLGAALQDGFQFYPEPIPAQHTFPNQAPASGPYQGYN